MLTQSWRSKSAVFRMYHALTLNGYSNFINAVKRQRNLGLCFHNTNHDNWVWKKKKKTTYYVRWMINIVDFSINLLLYRRQILLLQGIVDKSLEACISNFCRVLLVSDKWLCFLLTGERMVKLNTIKRGAHSNLFHIVLKYFIIIYRAVLGTREKQCTGTPTYTTTLKKHTIRKITRL